MTETTRPRQNREGHLCPPWCRTDHDEVHGPAGTFGYHGGEAAGIELPGRTSLPDRVDVRAAHAGHPGDEAAVCVIGSRHGAGGEPDEWIRPDAWLRPRDACGVAGIIEMLAAATPAQHRKLAEAIRRAAAQVTEAGDD